MTAESSSTLVLLGIIAVVPPVLSELSGRLAVPEIVIHQVRWTVTVDGAGVGGDRNRATNDAGGGVRKEVPWSSAPVEGPFDRVVRA